MPHKVEATAAAHGHGVTALVLLHVIIGELRSDRDQRWVKRGNSHDALL
jgi:hypothetical protein